MMEDDSRFMNTLRMAHQDLSTSLSEARSAPNISVNPDASNTSSRIQLPISSYNSLTDSIGFPSRTYLPRTGYEILDEMPSVHIEQTFELNENLSSVNSENRFIVRSPLGEALFAATESSTERDRSLWGAQRPFQMHLLDQTYQEALTLHRKCAVGFFSYQKRYIEVWSPGSELLGVVVEEPTCFSNEFTIKNDKGHISYKIKGISSNNVACGCCYTPSEGHFDIYGFDSETCYGSITRKWSSDISQYSLNIYFSDINMNVKSKALLVGAGFLIEYLCFQSRFKTF